MWVAGMALHSPKFLSEYLRNSWLVGYYQAEDSTSAAGYLVDHTPTVMVIDRNGELNLLVSFEDTDFEVADDLAYLVG